MYIERERESGGTRVIDLFINQSENQVEKNHIKSKLFKIKTEHCHALAPAQGGALSMQISGGIILNLWEGRVSSDSLPPRFTQVLTCP